MMKSESDILTLGIDIGSTSSKCVIMKNGTEIAANSLISLGVGSSGPKRAMEEVFQKAGIDREDIIYTVATGYGRNSLKNMADKELSELSCHAKGAEFLCPQVHTVIDIGGQDVKVIHVENGQMMDFQMNDKCASGTGRFLEVMARVLEIDVGEMESLARLSKNPVTISSTCTVFAESEVISQLSKENIDRSDIIGGILRSVASRVAGLALRLGTVEPVIMTGGVSRNKCIVEALEEELSTAIMSFPLSPYAGAIGAALFAYKAIQKAG